jgi:tetratricopeptide (TPR) repeat protein
MGTRRMVGVCVAFLLSGIVASPVAVAWGPNASRAICLCALQVVQRDVEKAFQGRENDLVAGATVSDAEMTRYAVQTGQIEPFQPVIGQIALLRRAHESGMTDYLAYRFGVVAKMTANILQPFGIPEDERERRLKEKLDADIEEHIDELKPKYRQNDREFLYYPASYFRERMRFLDDAEYFISQEYAAGDEYGDDTRRAVTKYFEEAVHAIADVWYTALSDRDYFGSDVPPSARDLTRYYAEQVAYFLQKSRPEKAEESYEIFAATNPGLAEPYQTLGDAYYQAGNYERAMEEYRRGLSMKGGWPAVEQKILGHYTNTAENLLAQDTREGFQKALQAYEKALEVSPGNPAAVRGRERAKSELEALEARLDRDRKLLAGANRLFEDAGQAESAKDLAKAIDLYEKAAALYSLVSSEFEEQRLEAQAGSEDAARQIKAILSNAISQAKDLISQASEREDQGAFQDAINLYERVPNVVAMIPQKYTNEHAEAQRLIQNAATRKEAAKTQLESQQTQPGQPPRQTQPGQ